MKNFRKVLALVLVVAMLFSFTAMSSAKTLSDFEDADKVTYKTAVDVMAALEIVEGYEDDTFQPTATISREEMAAMIARLANAGDDVSELYAVGTTFADVPKDRWSASVVAYCANEGIVAGRSSTTFDPTGKVTALETAKMLLVVLGFSAEEQGYVNNGNAWKAAVQSDAKLMGLWDGFPANYNPDANITRELAAQMMLNALEAPCVVGVLSNDIVKVTNALVVNWPGLSSNVQNLLKVTAAATLKDAMEKGCWALYGNVVISNDPLIQTLYGSRIETSDGNDCQGRPGTQWEYINARGKSIVKSVQTVAADKIAWTKTTLATAYAKELDYGYTVEVWVDGDNTTTTDTLAEVDDISGNGVRVETYVDEDAKLITVVVINPYWGVVTSIKELAKTATLDNGDVLPAAGLAKKDVVLYHKCSDKDGIHDYTVVEPETAKVEYYRDYSDVNKSYFTAEDEYLYNVKWATGRVTDANKGKEYNIYVDEYGFAFMLGTITTDKTQVAYAVEGTVKSAGIDKSLSAKGEWSENEKFVGKLVVYGDEAGKVEPAEYALDETAEAHGWDIVDLIAKTGSATQGAGVLFTYELDSNKEVEVKSWANFAPRGTLISSSRNELLADELYANKNTKFMIRTTNPSTKAKTYEMVIGYQNLEETYVAADISWDTAECTTIQYIDADNNGIVEYVFIDAIAVKTSATYLLLSKAYDAGSVTLPNYKNYDGYKALVDGELSIVLFADGTEVELNTLYTGADMVLDADTKYDDNLPLYVAVGNKATAFKTEREKFVLNYADGEYQVKLGSKWKICADGFNVFYIDGVDKLVDEYFEASWVKVEEKLYAELFADSAEVEGYVLYDSAKNVSDLYIILEQE